MKTSRRSSPFRSWLRQPRTCRTLTSCSVALRPRSLDERCLRAHHAELVSLRVGQDCPRFAAGLADGDSDGAQRLQAAYLGVAVLGLGREVQVDAVLDRL